MDDPKSALKLARDAIDRNDFDEATKQCKSVLKKDKNNYMALVMLGVALQDSEQAPLAFKKAISIKDDKAFAWQGLSSFYEKRNDKFLKELLQTYKRLFQFENNFSRFTELCDKVYTVGIQQESAECGNILLQQILAIQDDENKHKKASQVLVKMLSELNCSMFNADLLSLFEKIIQEPKVTDILDCKIILNFIRCVYELRGIEATVKTYSALTSSLQHDMFSVECWILEVFCRGFIMDDQEYYCIDVATLTESVLKINPKSSTGLLTKAVLFLQKNDVLNAHNLGRLLFEADADKNVMLPIFLGKCCVRLQRWSEAELFAMTVIRRNKEGLPQAHKILLISLTHQGDTNKSRGVLETLEKVNEEELSKSDYKALFVAYMNINEFQKAEEFLKKLENTAEYYSFQASVYKSKGDLEMYKCVLENNVNIAPHCWLPLGQFYMEQQKYENALIPLLQAAKFDPNNFEAFSCLGDYYKVVDKNLEKAKKCYSKAFNLNPECSRAGKLLSSIYRSLGNWDDNFNFLRTITSSRGTQESWSWLELGLHHLALEQWDEAILHLRTFVRWNPKDTEAWESLADAYYSRGSFTSALKCYQQATELDNGRKYSFVQIGSIQYTLGEYVDALKTYMSINDQSFLPALKGMAEVKVAMANQYLSENLYGSCQESAQEAIKLISSAIMKENHFSCLWNILSNAISIISKLPVKYCWLYIEAQFSGQENALAQQLIKNKDVFLLAIRCFCRTINLSSSKCNLYFELAIVYLDFYKMFEDIEMIQKAFSSIKMCLELEKNEWQYWNLLGVVCTCKGIKKYSLAQHSLIKAIQLDFSNAMIWSNLGVLYFHMGEEMLAHQSFSKGQQFDPLYLQSWIGQALLAERWSRFDESGDLFRHSSQMGFHKESCLGYAESVCTLLSEPSDEVRRKAEYYMKHMHAIPTACDLMACLNEYERSNACSLNIYGVLLEKMGLLKKAAGVFENALEYVDEEYRDIVLVNLGRILYRIGEYDRSIETFKSLSETTLNSACGLALALFKVGDCEKSMSVYSTALQWLAERDRDRSDLLVAMACMAYMNEEVHDAKTLLFQCLQIDSDRPSFYALQAAFALGMLLSDETLSQLVMAEIYKYKNDSDFIEPVAFLESYSVFKRKSPLDALHILSRYIHIFPDNSKLWEILSKFCIMKDYLNANVASKSAQKVIQLNQDCDSRVKYYIMVSVSEMLLGNHKTSLKFAQNAVHSQPDVTNNWVFLKNLVNQHFRSR